MAQSASEYEALNTYISFLNESVHGLVIAHIVLVNNNKDLNRYIDLESTKTVNISTSDLPSNIFDKPDDDSDFYEISPIELSEICYSKSAALNSSLAQNLNGQTQNIVQILTSINAIRFDIEDYILSHDLNEKESVYGVYEYLERVVRLFEEYAQAHKKMANDINKAIKSTDDELYLASKEIHSTTKSILRNLRRENESNVGNNINRLQAALDKFDQIKANYSKRSLSAEYDYYTKTISEKTEKVIALVKEYENPGFVPVEHELYGKHYYYHNQLLIHYFNWSGPGFVRDMNTILNKLKQSFIVFDEEPLIFKVIYPVKILEAQALNEKKTFVELRGTPQTDRDMEFSEIEKKETPDPEPPIVQDIQPQPKLAVDPPIEDIKPVIVVDKNTLVIDVYDHNMIDRDSITLSLNGEIILENFMLSDRPERLVLKLKENQTNLLKVEAKNLGLMPPNTLAIAYRFQGKRKKVIIETDLETDQVVEIDLEN